MGYVHIICCLHHIGPKCPRVLFLASLTEILGLSHLDMVHCVPKPVTQNHRSYKEFILHSSVGNKLYTTEQNHVLDHTDNRKPWIIRATTQKQKNYPSQHMCKSQHRNTVNMKKWSKMSPPKVHNSTVTDSKNRSGWNAKEFQRPMKSKSIKMKSWMN